MHKVNQSSPLVYTIKSQIHLSHKIILLYLLILISSLSIYQIYTIQNDPLRLQSIKLINTINQFDTKHRVYKSGWFAIQLHHGPIQFFNEIEQILPLNIIQCIHHIHEGNLLVINKVSDQVCYVKTKRISARDHIILEIPLLLNHASLTELQMIKGVGHSLAQKIIKGRPWNKIEDLVTLKGVGSKKLQWLKRYLTMKPYKVIYSISLTEMN
jgi:hypothetical protein